MRLLYLTARLPYPLLKGDQVVVYHRLRELGQRHRITLLTGYEHPDELRHLAALQPFCERIIPVPLSRRQIALNLLGAVFSGVPFQVAYYQSAALKRACQSLDPASFDLVHGYRLSCAGLIDPTTTPAVLDLMDSLTLNLARRRALGRDGWLMRMLLREEYRRVAAYEARQVERFPATVVVSAVDAAALPGGSAVVIPNGVDTEVFRRHDPPAGTPTLVFSGNWAYHPNIAALTWFLATCWPAIRASVPGAVLHVVGTRPPRWLRMWHGREAVRVTGYVPSMAEALQEARVAIAPMRSGSGIQNKILEAMACALPVVTTTLGKGSIAADPVAGLLVADDPATFRRTCIDLLTNPAQAHALGQRAATYVREVHSWAENARRVEEVYGNVTRRGHLFD